MADVSSNIPCTLCEEIFLNPRDLAVHILDKHCSDFEGEEDNREEEEEEDKSPMMTTTTTSLNNNGGIENIIQVDVQLHEERDSPLPRNLPRTPTPQEERLMFMIATRPNSVGEQAKYICLHCGKAYTSRYNIRCHLNMHSGKNVYSCPYCSRFFAHKHVFDSHLRTHTGERPFSCEKCGRAFTDRSNRSSHQKKCRGKRPLELSNGEVSANGRDVTTSSSDHSSCGDAESLRDSIDTPPLRIVTVKSMAELCNPPDTNGRESSDLDMDEDGEVEEIIVEPDELDNSLIQGSEDIKPIISPIPSMQISQGLNVIPLAKPARPPRTEPGPLTILFPVQQHKLPLSSHPPQAVPPPAPCSATYLCSFCNTKFDQQASLITHVYEHVKYPNRPSLEELNDGHMTFIVPSTQKSKSMCLFCGKTFNKMQQVKIHMNVHNGDNIYNCRFCDRVFANLNAFSEHAKSHTEEYKFNCKFCNEAFMNRNVMVTHQRDCPRNPESHKIKASSSSSSSSSSITPRLSINLANTPEDMKLLPPLDKRPKIILNSEEIKSLIEKKDEELRKQEEAARAMVELNPMVSRPPGNFLAKDIKIEPEDEIIIDEEESDTSYGDDLSLSDQQGAPLKPVIRKRPNMYPFEPEDHYVPDNNSNNVINRKEIIPPPTQAERSQGFCLRPFKNGQQRYICIICGKHYTTTYNMRQHRNIHTGKGLHSCRYCGRDFTHKHVWETHERIHTGERPFKCPTCNKDFADRSNYNSHRKLCAMNMKTRQAATSA